MLLLAAAIAASDFDPLRVLENGDVQIIVQRGRFDCPQDQHRVILQTRDGHAIVGCIDGGNTITLENGQAVQIEMKKQPPAGGMTL